MSAQDLSALLWRERELLDLLTFKLEEEQLLLTAGKSRWIQHGTREVEQVVERLNVAILAVAVEASAVAAEWGLPPESTLGALADGAPAGPWGDLLRGHLLAMTQQTRQIGVLRDANAQFLRAAARSTQETLAETRPVAGTYNARGHTGMATSAGLLDQKL
jgi:hypothetical protein